METEKAKFRKFIPWLVTLHLILGVVFISEAKSNDFKAALLTPEDINDGSQNSLAYAGLQLIKKELLATVSYTASKNSPQYEEDFRSYAEKGYNLIFGHGFSRICFCVGMVVS